MDKIKVFKSLEEYSKYVEKLKLKTLGFGAEGIVYKTSDGDTIKEYSGYARDDKIRLKPYKPDKYIMDGDINVDSFIFPTELHVCDGYICGYREAYFDNNVFGWGRRLDEIDLDKIVDARDKLIKDVKIMSLEGYKLYELCYNLMYNNKVFKAMDTLNYEKEKNPLEANLHFADEAVKASLELATDMNFRKCSLEKALEETKRIQKKYMM